MSSFFKSGCLIGSRECLQSSSMVLLRPPLKVSVFETVRFSGGLKWSMAYSAKLCGRSFVSTPFSEWWLSRLWWSLTPSIDAKYFSRIENKWKDITFNRKQLQNIRWRFTHTGQDVNCFCGKIALFLSALTSWSKKEPNIVNSQMWMKNQIIRFV